jgi:hypothetical protein
MHTKNDNIDHISHKSLLILAEKAEYLIRELADSIIFPFEKTMPDNVKTDVNKYFKNRWNVDK